MTDEIEKQFRKWAEDETDYVFGDSLEAGYWDSEIKVAREAFQAAYNLREQEIQRLRELVEWYKTGKTPSAETKQALRGEVTND